MFRPSVETFSSEEQLRHWGPKSTNADIHGCYAQTEIGHGSNVAGLETTAVFDRKTDEFVIHTPTPSATKWWPGDMGRYANHALVFAQLIVPDEDGTRVNHGVCPLIVQLRDMDTHKRMPGINCGDLGPKLGYHSKDNGWLSFDNVRVPRSHLLQRFLAVDRDGAVAVQGDPRVLYATMMLIRSSILSNTKYYLSRALTIAIRYSVVRRQFKNISGKKEET